MPVPQPPTRHRPIPGHFGRGRRDGLSPLLLVMHIQEGTNDLFFEFRDRPPGREADSTIWNPRGDDDQLQRFLSDDDTAWTNGSWDDPNLNNPVIRDLFQRGISTNDVSLTIEHAGFHNQGITEAQFDRTVEMCAHWCDRWDIPADRNHIIGHFEVGNHKSCPGESINLDRLVARVQRRLGFEAQTIDHFELIPMSYRVIVPAFKATVREGPGRAFPILATLDADPERKYEVDAEAHGELIGNDDVWSHLLGVDGQPPGFVTRTALLIVH